MMSRITLVFLCLPSPTGRRMNPSWRRLENGVLVDVQEEYHVTDKMMVSKEG